MVLALPDLSFRDAQSFLAWAEGAEGRWELVDGVAVELHMASDEHHQIVTNLVGHLTAQFRARNLPYRAFAEYRLTIPRPGLRPRVRIADVAVLAGETRATAKSPLLLVEIVSPSNSVEGDREKRADYRHLTSAQEYLQIYQAARAAAVWRRRGETLRLEDEPEGSAATLQLESLGLTLSLATLYEDTAIAEPDTV